MPADVHLLAYCGFLAGHLANDEPADWGYSFSSTQLGAPFATALARALDMSVGRGFIDVRDSELALTQEGSQGQTAFASLGSHVWRSRFLLAACDATVMIPLPVLREVIFLEPQLRFARGKTRKLMDEAGRGLFAPQATAVQSALRGSEVKGGIDSPLLSLLVWLDYLRQSNPGSELVS